MNLNWIFDMEATPIIGASLMIGSSIFMYIVAFLAVMAIGGYLTYRTSPKRKQRREDKRNSER
ncbi:hypothetical protein AK824_05800 [Psychrobacter sp. P11G3]|mgnify:CR=1 FL=1|jgi:hypothetical protein|nr:hypothetical protein AK824_05800 [Psychrobacter sp. P11G3]|tara:strand:+ start:13055 stop:13243 length:189 start_codon:yes stop_codon:yes gene_type:complete